MFRYKLKAPRQYGNMPKNYEFIVLSKGNLHAPNMLDIEEEIKRLGFNQTAQSYRSPGNFIITKLS